MADVPMDIDYTSHSTEEPPRKRTHYEANADMDWEPHTAAAHFVRPSSIFSNAASGSGARTGGGGKSAKPSAEGKYSSAFLSSASSKSPFLFPSSELQGAATSAIASASASRQEPVASTLTSKSIHTDQVQSPGPGKNQTASSRDIAHGAVQRERRKRDPSKELQLVHGGPSRTGPDASILEDEHGREDDASGDDEADTSFLESISLSAPIKTLFRRAKSGRHRQGQAPVHFSLHNHNHHWPISPQDPFVFGAVSPPVTNYADQQRAPAQALPPSGWRQKDTPYILLGYLQFTLNASLVLLSLYILFSLVLQLRSDVSERVTAYGRELQQEILHCSSQYVSNRCMPGERVPAMERQCTEWEYCMNKDPEIVNKLRVTSEVLAEVINGFVETMTFRTMAFLLATLFVLVAYTNRTITTYRQQHIPSALVDEQQWQRGQARPKLASFSSAPPALEEIN